MSGLGSALSLLASMSSQYSGLQKGAPTPPSLSKGVVPAASAPVNVPNSNASGNATTISTPPSNPASNLCEVCNTRAKYHDGVKLHPYCGKGCALQVKANGKQPRILGPKSNQSGVCDFCHNRPKYVDGHRTHEFCSIACAQDAKMAGKPPRKSLSTSKNTCQAPGCQQPARMNTNGTPGNYCSSSHRTLVETLCLICRQAPKQPTSHFCGQACNDEADTRGPAVLEVPVGHVTFKSVTDQFKASWRHSGTVCPTVKKVYKILATPSSLANYDAYRTAVEKRGQFVAAGRSAGNENRRWHGTRRECSLGDPGNTKFCASTTCSLCCIVRTSFDLSLFGKKTGWGRFGKGIYTSSTSSKSNDYSHNVTSSPLKAILLNKVVVGKGYKMTQDNTSMAAPPNGYDSVLAEKGGSLNYDELVVYTNDAIRPSFLVM